MENQSHEIPVVKPEPYKLSGSSNESVPIPIESQNGESNVTIRPNLVNIAVQFLDNPKVEKTTMEQRRKFLKSKGLTDLEIEEAFKKSRNIYPNSTNLVSPPNLPPPYNPGMSQQLTPQPVQPSFLIRLKDGITTAAVIGALLYGAYIFYKRYIVPLIFGKRKPKKSIEAEVQELTKELKQSTDEIRSTVIEIQSEITASSERNKYSNLNSQLEELKSEIYTVKSLLLSKKQFPVMSSSSIPPSIPAWQLASTPSDGTVGIDNQEEDKSPTDDVEVASGGSSETEVITKNNSDSSSIEII